MVRFFFFLRQENNFHPDQPAWLAESGSVGAPSDILVERDGEQYRAPDQASYQVRFFSVPTYITRIKHLLKIFFTFKVVDLLMHIQHPADA